MATPASSHSVMPYGASLATKADISEMMEEFLKILREIKKEFKKAVTKLYQNLQKIGFRVDDLVTSTAEEKHELDALNTTVHGAVPGGTLDSAKQGKCLAALHFTDIPEEVGEELDYIVSEEESGFIRQTGDNIQLPFSTIERATMDDAQMLLLSLDAEKELGRVNWPFLTKVLSLMKLGPCYGPVFANFVMLFMKIKS
ncbi:hypothetical protein NDU88_003961 [Pleurodeles waltl]|uniref:Uncharacterized protein n=1 Tax=Pleurodeles waltl TaxID=8319 RepID=A0AAV7T706_PLEWA|nr:hypothetical protein NDU88_003961 [Pleurodeles waltl]